MNTSEIFLIAMGIIFTVPYLIWRLARTEYFAPLVVVQILTGILLGPGVLGALVPTYYTFVFNPSVVQALNGIAWWAVMSFVWIAGVELDLKTTWAYRRESAITAGLALGVPLLFGSVAAIGIARFPGWVGPKAIPWQFTIGVGMRLDRQTDRQHLDWSAIVDGDEEIVGVGESRVADTVRDEILHRAVAIDFANTA